MNAAAGGSWRGWLWPCPHLLPPPKDLPALPERSHPRAQGQGPKDRGNCQPERQGGGERPEKHIGHLGRREAWAPVWLEAPAPSEHELRQQRGGEAGSFLRH